MHSSPLLASAEPSVRVEGETIPTQLELDANKLSMLSWSRSCRVCWDGGESSSTPASWDPPRTIRGTQGLSKHQQLGLLHVEQPMVRGVAGGAVLWDPRFVALSDAEWLTEGSHA